MANPFPRFLNDSKVETLEAGGTFTMGATNSSLYTGDIDYQNIPANEVTYWIQQLSSQQSPPFFSSPFESLLKSLTELTVNGNSVSIPTGNGAFAAIDTGTVSTS
jgi:cathepsin D